MSTENPLFAVDLVNIAEVAQSVRRLGDRYLRRVFTDHELACCCDGPSDSVATALALRFAAKEATLKVLRPPKKRPDWQTIEVVRLPTGVCRLRLRGAAARLALERGLGPFTLSLTHEAGLAAAVVTSGSANLWGRQTTMEPRQW